MNDRRYLQQVLKLSIAPRAVTFFLTLVSFPLMVRSVGASAYGIIIYLGAVVGVLESGVDFGVSSAAGKAIAEGRAQRPNVLRSELIHWIRLQCLVAVLGFAPLWLISYLIVERSRAIPVESNLLLVVVLTSWITIAANFVRACMRSCMEFKGLMIMDTAESIIRSTAWVLVALFLPTAIGVAIAALVTVVLISILGTGILVRVVRRDYPQPVVFNEASRLQLAIPSYSVMVRDSLGFLGLRLATRVFQALPIVLIGRIHGPATVGVLGAFSKFGELINLPFGVIGNALAVRAHEVILRRSKAIIALWNAVLRFMALSVVLAVVVYFGAGQLANFLAPEQPTAPKLFAILSATIVTSAASSMIAPMSDYVGALRQRIILLTCVSILQLPLIWIGNVIYGAPGTILGYVVALCVMMVGYTAIAKTAYFGSASYKPSPDLLQLFVVIACALLIAGSVGAILSTRDGSRYVDRGVVEAVVFAVVVAMGIVTNRVLRTSFATHALFDFTDGMSGIDLGVQQTSLPQ